MDTQEWLAQVPRVSDALKKGSHVTVAMWNGQERSGLVCDREETGLLLDLGEGEEGYVFLPWSSIEQVAIRDVPQRRVKFLPG